MCAQQALLACAAVGGGAGFPLDWAGIGHYGVSVGLTESFLLPRLHDVLHSDKKLTLVFEFCDQVNLGGSDLGEGIAVKAEVKLSPILPSSSFFRT